MGLHYYCHYYAGMRIKHLHFYRLDSRQAVGFDQCRHGQYRTENGFIFMAGRVALHRSDCHYRGLYQFSKNHLITTTFDKQKRTEYKPSFFIFHYLIPHHQTKNRFAPLHQLQALP